MLLSANAGAWGLYPYAEVGIGYKLDEPDYAYVDMVHPDDGKPYRYKVGMYGSAKDTALFEAGFETNVNVSFGLKHDSHWSTGWPVDKQGEYYKTEIFVKYKIGGKP